MAEKSDTEASMSGGIEKRDANKLVVSSIDRSLIQAMTDDAFVPVERDGMSAASVYDAVAHIAPEIAKIRERSGLVRLEVPSGFTAEDVFRGADSTKVLGIRNAKGRITSDYGIIRKLGMSGIALNALSIVSFVAGQQMLMQIEKSLDALQSSVDDIRRHIERERHSKLKGRMKTLSQIWTHLDDIVEDENRRISAYTRLEHVQDDLNEYWEYVIALAEEWVDDLRSRNYGKAGLKKVDLSEIEKALPTLSACDAEAAFILESRMIACLLKSQLNANYNERSFVGEVEGVLDDEAVYRGLRDDGTEKLVRMSGRVKGPLIDFDGEEKKRRREALRSVDRIASGSLTRDAMTKYWDWLDAHASEGPLTLICDFEGDCVYTAPDEADWARLQLRQRSLGEMPTRNLKPSVKFHESQRDALVRIASTLDNWNVLQWLRGLEWSKERNKLIAPMREYAENILDLFTSANLAGEIRRGYVSDDDADCLAYAVSYVLNDEPRVSLEDVKTGRAYIMLRDASDEHMHAALVVHVTSGGRKYHKENCYLIRSKATEQTGVRDAEERGLTPCARCF